MQTQVNWITDSTGAGTIFGHATFQGGKGRAGEYVANKLASIPGMGPVLSPGDRLVGSTALDPFPTTEMAYAGTGWQTVLRLTAVTATHGGSTAAFTSTSHGLLNGTPVVVGGLVNTLGGGISNGTIYYVVGVTTNTFGLAATSGGTALTLGGSSNDLSATIGMPYDKLPFGKGQIASGASNWLALDATKYAGPIVAVDVIVVDLVGGGDLSYSIDGNATWTACGQSMGGGNGILRFRIMTPGMTTSLRVRCADAAGTAVLGFPGGFRPWYIDHTTVSNGVIVNDYGSDGMTLHNFITTTVAGDHAAILDSVTLGTGSPLGNAPTVTLMLHLNDANYPTTASGTSWSTDAPAFKTRAGALGPVVLIGCWEADPTFFDVTVQAAMRSTLAGLADSNTYYLDLNGAYGAMGYSGNAAISAGLWLQDKIHLHPFGEADVGSRLFSTLRNGPLSTTIGGNVAGFTLGKSLLGGTDVFGGYGIVTPSAAITDTGIGGSSVARTAAHPRSLTDSGLGGSSIGRASQTKFAVTDQAVGASAVGRVEADPRALTDQGLGSSSVTRTDAGARAITDLAVGLSSVSRLSGDERGVTDLAVGSSALVRTVTGSRALTDVGVGGTSLVRTTGGTRAITDVAAGTSTVVRIATPYRSINAADFALGGSAIARTIGRNQAIVDAALGTTSVGLGRVSFRNLTDVALGSSSVNATGGGPGALVRNITDSALGASALVRTSAGARALTDTVVGASSIGRTVAWVRSSTDLAVGGSAVARTSSQTRTITDLMNPVAAIGETAAHPRAITDTGIGASSASVARARMLTDQMSPQVVPFTGADGIVQRGTLTPSTGLSYFQTTVVAVFDGALSTLAGHSLTYLGDGPSPFSPDPTFDRIDVSTIGPKGYGSVFIGTPSANPVPPITFPLVGSSQLLGIAQIRVPAGATSAAQLTFTDIQQLTSFRAAAHPRALTDVGVGGSTVSPGRLRLITDVALGSSSSTVGQVTHRTLTDTALGGSSIATSGGLPPVIPSSAFRAGQGGTIVAWRAGETRTSIGAASTVIA